MGLFRVYDDQIIDVSLIKYFQSFSGERVGRNANRLRVITFFQVLRSRLLFQINVAENLRSVKTR